MIPRIVDLLATITEQKDQRSEMLKFYVEDVFEQMKSQIPSEFESRLRDYFKKWVELSQIDDPEHQEREINNFFDELQNLGIYKEESQSPKATSRKEESDQYYNAKGAAGLDSAQDRKLSTVWS